MFGAFKKICKNAQNLNTNEVFEGIMDLPRIQEKVVSLNQQQMYEQGENAKGEQIGQYAYNTIVGTTKYEGKIAKGQRYDHITLLDTGEFYGSMKVLTGTEGFLVTGDTEKEDIDIGLIYPDILGLTQESKSELIVEVKPLFVEETKRKILTR